MNGFVEEIVISKERMNLLDNDITEHERHMLRSTLGSLSWKAGQSGPQFSADVGLLLSAVTKAKVSDLVLANKLVKEVKMTASQTQKFHAWDLHWSQIATGSG